MSNTSGVHTWLILRKASAAVEARVVESIEHAGLNQTDFSILETLLHKGTLPVNTLGKKLLLTSGSITTAVDRLVTRGLVARKDHDVDRRIRLVELTKAGRKLITPAFERHAKDLETITSVLSAKDRAALIALLKKLGKDAEQQGRTET
jgi:MarR family 2-MHQ and catechol resistance regulon transcriptional repressor